MDKKDSIIKTYAKQVKKTGMLPTIASMAKNGVSRDAMRHHFGSITNLKSEVKKRYPELFQNVIDEDFFSPERAKKLIKALRSKRRFVITTAVTGCKVHLGFYNAISTYCKKNDAELLVLVSSDPAAISSAGGFIDPTLQNEHIIMDDVRLNRNIVIRGIKLSAKAADPTRGLSRIGQRSGSFIHASPKQRLKMTATSNVKLPHAIMTTGAVTLPDYNTEIYQAERTAYIAEHDHVIGALIVEIENEELFHYRQVQADRSGAFADLGVLYSGSGVVGYPADSLVLGDWHSGETDPLARAAFVEASDSVVAIARPKRLVIHDGFNGNSISHHEEKNKLLRAKRASHNQLNLEAELEGFGQDLAMMTSKVKEVVVVKSNHDEFLDRYLQEGRYVDDAHNHKISLVLAYSMLEGNSPLKSGIELLGFNLGSKVRWLDRDEDFKVAGIELGAHGDKGNNGAKGSIVSMEQAYGLCVTGHSHTPEILRGAFQVGTCSLLKLEYNKGPSSWMHTSCLVYPNGQRQLINAINGKWRLSDGKKKR